MKILLWVLGVLVLLVAVVAGVGWMLPVKHRASRQAGYPVAPEVLFASITDVERFPSWRPKVQHVDVTTSATQRLGWRETGSDGVIPYVAEELDAPRRLVTRIADPSLPFGGTWTYELTPSGAGTTLRITEDGEVYNPVFRFMSRFVFGHGATIEAYLRDLGKLHGASPVVSA